MPNFKYKNWITNQRIPKQFQNYSSLSYERLVWETLRFDNTLQVKILVSSAEPAMTFEPWWKRMKTSVIRNWDQQSTAPGRRVLLDLRLTACSLTHCCMAHKDINQHEKSIVLSPRHFCKEWERNSMNIEISWFTCIKQLNGTVNLCLTYRYCIFILGTTLKKNAMQITYLQFMSLTKKLNFSSTQESLFTSENVNG